MAKSKYRMLFKDVVIFGLGTLGSKLILFLLLPLYTKALTSEEYGVADLVFSVSELLRPFISLAIYNGLQRYGLAKDCDKDQAFRCATMVFLAGTAITFAAAPLFGLYGPVREWRWYLAAYAVTVFASKNVMIYLKITDQNKLYAVLSILQAFLLAVGSILLLVVWRRGIPGYLTANILAPLVVVVVGFLAGGACRGLSRSSYNGSLMKEMVRYSVPFIMNDISWWLIHSSDKLMIEGMIDADALGIYTAASKIPLLINVVMAVFGQAWDLSVVKEYENENNRDYYSKVLQYFAITVFGICICIVLGIKPFMRVYVGGAFQSAWRYVPLLLFSAAFAALDMFVTTFFTALKKSSAVMWPTVFGGIVNVALNFYFIQRMGIWGAVLGTAAAYLLMLSLRIVLLRRALPFDMHLKKAGLLALAAGVQALLVGLDVYGGVVSTAVLTLYFLVSFRELVPLAKFILRKAKNRGR